jgi:DNA-nicking Smr family endonuclease
MRQTVRSILAWHPDVLSFTDDHAQFGGWGATLVKLKAKTDSPG